MQSRPSCSSPQNTSMCFIFSAEKGCCLYLKCTYQNESMFQGKHNTAKCLAAEEVVECKLKN